jgi:hypothetical protein
MACWRDAPGVGAGFGLVDHSTIADRRLQAALAEAQAAAVLGANADLR